MIITIARQTLDALGIVGMCWEELVNIRNTDVRDEYADFEAPELALFAGTAVCIGQGKAIATAWA